MTAQTPETVLLNLVQPTPLYQILCMCKCVTLPSSHALLLAALCTHYSAMQPCDARYAALHAHAALTVRPSAQALYALMSSAHFTSAAKPNL